MADLTLTPEDRETIQAILLAARTDGTPYPVLPADVDLDGDGLADGYGLDADGNVVIVYSAPLKNTLYEATGEEGK